MSSLPKYEFVINDVINDGKVTSDEITEIRQWIPSADLPEVSDEFIVTFLIACKNNVENTKKAIHANFHLKFKNPELFDDRDIDREDIFQATNTILHASMPVRTDDDCVVHMFRLNDTKYYNFYFNQISKLCFMLVDVSLNTKSPPRGLKVVIDARGAGLMHLTRFKLKTLRTLVEYLQDGMPLNMTEIHILNTILMVDKLIFMIKPFMKPELYNMLNLHPNNTDLEEFSEKYIPKKCLPSDYGGDLPSFKELNEKTVERYKELKEFYRLEEKLIRNWSKELKNSGQ